MLYGNKSEPDHTCRAAINVVRMSLLHKMTASIHDSDSQPLEHASSSFHDDADDHPSTLHQKIRDHVRSQPQIQMLELKARLTTVVYSNDHCRWFLT